ncbi:MAG TPA: saccharopine dehydrogenase C-terminal domain-containing protein [Thermoanaerobaculaceae bacterium]|nr:saccharopine dehydrogenase C-terminal domain-containing protein [Thermoanaerobaculaceae bacterium]HRS17292.1 saccharopine dehydrogenase C-terminal domain-containing protein [Thermoanaerobaculaceae bacterium]
MRVAVLGCGLVGHAIVADLARSAFAVTAVDREPGHLARVAGLDGVRTVVADLADPAELAQAVADAELVVGAVPGFMGYATVQRALELRKPVVDISFFPEDPFDLDALARRQGVPAFVDCGVAPGCSNLLAGWATRRLDAVERLACYVGGLPVVRTWPWEYKAPFSPADVLEEYTRPARLVERGVLVSKPALSDRELVEVEGVGTLEAFNTDGLRTLLRTLAVPDMAEKTLRYPGHIEKILLLRESGFLATEPVRIGGVEVAPLALASRLLFPLWRLGPDDEDFTVMRVIAEGRRAGGRARLRWDLHDRCDRATRTASMARTTGYTCTAVVRLWAGGRLPRTGVVPLELVGREEGLASALLADLAERGVSFVEREESLAGA